MQEKVEGEWKDSVVESYEVVSIYLSTVQYWTDLIIVA